MSATTQSWAAWLLDSYASSVSPVAESPYREGDGPQPGDGPRSSSKRSTSTPLASSSSPYGPYTRSGRGGAGNFTWQSDIDSQPRDIEAQNQSSLSERRKAAAKLEHINIGDALKTRRSSAQYVTTGRGGAGNYTQGNSAQPVRSPTLNKNSPNRNFPVYTGRGGAGNFAATAEVRKNVEDEIEMEERLSAEKRREQIEEEVGYRLQPPPGAFLGPRRKSEALLEAAV